MLELDDGTFVTYAHLRRRSARVRAGQRVAAGEVLAECGNFGNSTEPHLHVQAQDRRSLIVAAGLPVAFDGASVEGEPVAVPPATRPATFTLADHSAT